MQPRAKTTRSTPALTATALGAFLAVAASVSLIGASVAAGVTPTCFGSPPTITGSGHVAGTPGNDVIITAPGQIDDSVFAKGGDDKVCTFQGKDVIHGNLGGDKLRAGNENDVANGGGGNDTVFAGAGKDSASGGGNRDTVHGQGGGDTVTGDFGRDFLFGGSGNDSLDGGPGVKDRCQGNSGTDTATNCEVVFGVP
jgi:Ca2+-binding RTX toxin-like protein